MCKYCEDIDRYIKTACEDAKQGNPADFFGALYFKMAVENLGVLTYSMREKGKNYEYIVFADGRTIRYDGDCCHYAVEDYSWDVYKRTKCFNFCPHCGRQLKPEIDED